MLEGLILYLLNRKIDNDDDKFVGIRKETFVDISRFCNYYIIPTIRITKTGKYLEIIIYLINIECYMYYKLIKESDEP